MISRRRFLKGTVLVAAAAGCADTSATSNTSADAGGTPDTGATDVETELPTEDGSAYFPTSVASGDPKPNSVVLWTRALVPAEPAGEVGLRLELSETDDFSQLIVLTGGAQALLTASADHDHCVKVRVEGLQPDTTYHYRFVIVKRPASEQAVRLASRTGRTHTAPDGAATRALRFAYVSCQDFNGRHYNSYKRLLALEPEPEFVVHLGDYIYETTADPRFQVATPGREVLFTDKAGALTFDAGTDTEYQAARSLDNYRELYRIYRSDPALMAAHERHPFIFTWDDHEFTDDAWGAHGTYFNGEQDEADEERRRNASQAWSEYQPVDFADPDFSYDRSKPLGEDITVYRDLSWGAHCHLFLTDGRSYRPDHLVPEEAYPGAVAATEAELIAAWGAVPEYASPYVDIDAYAAGAYKAPLLDAGGTASKLTGLMNVDWINKVLAARLDEGETGDPLAITDVADLPRGLSWSHLGKTREYGSLGSRYFAIWDAFKAVARVLHKRSAGAAQDVLGAAQETWLTAGINASASTWKFWCSPFCMTTHVVDLTIAGSLPASFRQRWALVLDDFNGFPDKLDELLDAVGDAGNVVVLSGDLHSFWASQVSSESGKSVVEFAGGAISSGTLQTLLVNSANSDPDLKAAGAAALALGADSLLISKDTLPNPGVGWVRTNLQGISVVDVTPESVTTTYHTVHEAKTKEPMDDAQVASEYATQRFQARAGDPALYGEFKADGSDALVWMRWSRGSGSWEPVA